MKVLILTPSFHRTGPEQGAFSLAKYLHERGQETVFAALDAGDHGPTTMTKEIEASGLPIQDFDMPGWPGLRHLGRVQNYVRDNAIEVVLSYNLRPDIVNSFLSGPTRIGANREFLAKNYELNYGRIRGGVGAKIHARAMKKLDGMFVLTRAMGDHLVEKGVDVSKIHKVNNFVDVAEIRKAHAAAESQPDGYTHIGYFGALIRRKRVDVALRALGRLVHDYECKAVKLHIVGDGPLRLKLMRLANELELTENTVFHGFLSSPLELMREMQLVLLTSESEGLPRCLLEAMALGKTCIASDARGVDELIRHGETGYLFHQGDIEALALLMNEIVSSRRYLDSEHLHSYMTTNYDVGVCAGAMFRHFEQITRARNSLSR